MMMRTVFTASLMLLPFGMATADDSLGIDNEAQNIAAPVDAVEASAGVVQVVVDDPASNAIEVEASVADAPVADAPVADAPVADAPVADAPVADSPVADSPVADAPVAEAQAADAPSAEANIAEEAVVEIEGDYPQPITSNESAVMATEGAQAAPVKQHRHHAAPSRRSSGGVFSELMELERRKNAWLKRTFLGR